MHPLGNGVRGGAEGELGSETHPLRPAPTKPAISPAVSHFLSNQLVFDSRPSSEFIAIEAASAGMPDQMLTQTRWSGWSWGTISSSRDKTGRRVDHF
jgi:hypothetical protein